MATRPPRVPLQLLPQDAAVAVGCKASLPLFTYGGRVETATTAEEVDFVCDKVYREAQTVLGFDLEVRLRRCMRSRRTSSCTPR
jgi:hypothetical protein